MNRLILEALIISLVLVVTGLIVVNAPEQGKNFTPMVTYTGNISVEDYKFVFVDKIEDDNGSTIVTGRSWPYTENPKIVKIRSNRFVGEITKTCNHEVLHYYFPDYRHANFSKEQESRTEDSIYKLADNVYLDVCDKVVSKAVEKSDNPYVDIR